MIYEEHCNAIALPKLFANLHAFSSYFLLHFEDALTEKCCSFNNSGKIGSAG